MTITNLRRHLIPSVKTRRLAIMAAATTCAIFGSHVAWAQTINFDVPGGVGAVNYFGTGAASDSGIYWNPIAYQSTSSGGLLSDGATVSPITLTDTSPNYFNPGQGAQGTPGGLEAPYAYENNGTPATESLNNVPAGTYNLFLYGKNYPYAGRGTTFSVSVGSTSYGTESTVGTSTTSFTLGNDYVVFSNVVVTAGDTITFTYAANTSVSGNGEGDFNGLQLVNQAGGGSGPNPGPSPGPSVTAVWTGSANGNWDIGTTANWLTNGVAGVYSQGNVVQFNDSSAVNTINLTAVLTPTNVLIDNNSANYIFAGNGTLSGTNTFSLTKMGSAMLTISNANFFSGLVNVGGGILRVGNSAALGNGTGLTTVSNGATLDLNGFNIGNQPVVIAGSGSSGHGAINNTGGAVYPAISQVTMAGDTTLGNSGGIWQIKPQTSGGTASLSTGGNPYNLTIVGGGFIGLYGVTVDSALNNIDVQAGTFDLENTTSGSLGNTAGTLTLESGTILSFYSLLNPVSKPTIFNSAALSNNGGLTIFTGSVTLNGYSVFGLNTSLSFNGTITGSGELEVQAGSGTFGMNGTNSYTGDIYMDANVGPLTFNGPGLTANGTVYLSENDSLTVDGSFGGSATDSGATGTSFFGNGNISGSLDVSGFVNPGHLNSVGTLTVGGLTLESGATLNMDLSSNVSGSNDLLQVNGNIVLNGNNVVLNSLDGHLQVGTYRLINYTGTLSGNFGALQTRAQGTIDTSTPGQVNLIVTDGGNPANLFQAINFDVPGGIGAMNYSGAGAASDLGIYWNPIVHQGISTGCLLSDGVTASQVTLSDTSPNSYNPGQGSQGTPGGLEAPYAYENNGTPATESLNNVPAGKYNLYLYGKNYPNADRGTTFSVSAGATSYGSQSTVCTSTTSFTLDNDYVVFSNVVVTAGETITFTYAANTSVSGNGEGDFNGLQLVPQSNTVIGGTHVVGGNFLMSGSGGTPFSIYYILTSTNLATPLSNWIPAATNSFDGGGNFSFTNTINAGSQQQFYLLEQP